MWNSDFKVQPPLSGICRAYKHIMVTLVEDVVEAIARKNLPVCVLGGAQAEVTAYRLAQDGFPSVGATTPQEALQHIRMNGCRVVLANSSMPGIDGLTFLDSVGRYNPGIYAILTAA